MATIILTGEVKGTKVEPDPDGNGQILFLQVQVTDPDDLQTVELMRHAGVDYTPVDDSTVAILEVHPAYKIAVACDDGVTPTAKAGEYEVYSSDGSGSKLAYTKCNDGGEVEINGTGDYAVSYNDLVTEFKELNDKFNELVKDHNSHGHQYTAPSGPLISSTPTVGGVEAVPPTITQTSDESEADITNTQVETVRLPND